MAVTDLFAGEIATELIKLLIQICFKSSLCKTSAEQLMNSVQELLPIIQEIKYSGLELPQPRQRQLDGLSEVLRQGTEVAKKALNMSKWHVYKNLQLARKMEKIERRISRFLNGPLQAHVLADVHHVRFESMERFDRLENSARRLEQQLGALRIGNGGGWMEEAVRRVEEEGEREDDCLVNLGAGMGVAKMKMKEMVIGSGERHKVLGICGIGGSGKTTLARDICRDSEVLSHFSNRVFFLTVSQSPNIEQLRSRIWERVTESRIDGSSGMVPQWNLQYEFKFVVKSLVILDDVWSLSVLQQLVSKIPGVTTLVISRFKFSPAIVNYTYELELLRKDEALSLFCHVAFGGKAIPFGANEQLVHQMVDECKGLPLALRVIGASLRGQSEMFWMSAKNRLSRSQPICESHEIQLLERMRLSIDCLPVKVRECFLDLGSFPEDKKIPASVLVSIWVELHDIDEEEAFAILIELADKNLIKLVKDARTGDIYNSYYDISITQHDVLRDLAIHLSNHDNVRSRKRLLMPRREMGIPKEWERNKDQPFDAQIVSIHTGDMREMDWPNMDFPKAEVLILNFPAYIYYLPPFIQNMPNLRALVITNHSTSSAMLYNPSIFLNLTNLTSLWFEKISLPHFPKTSIPMKNLKKLSLVLCKINNSLDKNYFHFPYLFPHLSELTIDHCVDLTELPLGICDMQTLKILSVTNCHGLSELPYNFGNLKFLQILRLYACPSLKILPLGVSSLVWLKYLDVSQCVKLVSLPERVEGLRSLEKIDMRECPQIRHLPSSTWKLQSLRRVVCDDDMALLWKDVERVVPSLCVQVAEECFNLDWLSE